MSPEAAVETLEGLGFAEVRDGVEDVQSFDGKGARAHKRRTAQFADAPQSFRRTGRPGALSRELLDPLHPGLEVEGQLPAALGEAESAPTVSEQGSA